MVWFAQHIGKLFHILFFKVAFYVKLFNGKILSWTVLVERLQLARLMTLVLEISRWPTWLPLFQACAKNFMPHLEKWWWGSYSTEVIIQTCLLILWQGDQTSRILRDCPIFMAFVSRPVSTLNGTPFVPYFPYVEKKKIIYNNITWKIQLTCEILQKDIA